MDKANKINIKKWVDALRSGKYKQGFGVLKKLNGDMCCLGVVTEQYRISEDNTNKIDWEERSKADRVYFDNYDCIVPSLVVKWLEIHPLWSIDVNFQGELISLGYLNDVKKLTFDEIADLIEETYLKEDKI